MQTVRESGDGHVGVTVGELRESGVLARILAQLGPARAASIGPGDDCAVLSSVGDVVVTTDTMIEGPDFRLAWHRGFDLGWKLAATNLSDVAAMGARPTALTVALACPKTTPVALLEEIARGIDAACRALAPGCGVVGGDLGQAPVLTAAVTALGDMEGRAPVTRAGAAPGDTVAYAGPLGSPASGSPCSSSTAPTRRALLTRRGFLSSGSATPRNSPRSLPPLRRSGSESSRVRPGRRR